MKLCIDWETVHQDWLASGLSKNRYFLSGRIEKFIRKKATENRIMTRNLLILPRNN